MQAVKDMLADLNAMLEADARGEHTQEQFDEFMGKHGEFFPAQPGDARGARRRPRPPRRRAAAADGLAHARSSARSSAS